MDGQSRRDAGGDRLYLLLVRWIAVGMEESDDQALATDGHSGVHGLFRGLLVKREKLAPVRADPLVDSKHAAPRNERRGAAGEEIVHVRGLKARELEHVFEPPGRQQPERRTLALDHRIDADGRSVGEIGHRARVDSVTLRQNSHALHDFRPRAVRPGQDLERFKLSGYFVEKYKIRE